MFKTTRIHFQQQSRHDWPLSALRLLAATIVLLAGTAHAQRQEGFLENPLDFGYESGISAVTGFHCQAQEITIQFDDYDPVTAASGTSRGDTEEYCGGNSDTGFSLLWNWNILGPGQHTVRALADGVEFDSATIEVNTFGAEFVWGMSLDTDIMDFRQGKEISLRWQESKQGFVIEDIEDMEFDLDTLIATVSGNWTGHWNSPLGTGTISMDLAPGFGRLLRLDNFSITGTGCATEGMMDFEIDDLEDPMFQLSMFDGSLLYLEFFVTESYTTLGGTFWIENGACADADGMFYMFK